jgi:hypothetical protein
MKAARWCHRTEQLTTPDNATLQLRLHFGRATARCTTAMSTWPPLGGGAERVPGAERTVSVHQHLRRPNLGGDPVDELGRHSGVGSVGGIGGRAWRVTVRDLVRNALRMRPDRIVVGEVRAARRSTWFKR